MPSMEEILITFLGRDEVSSVANNIASNTQSAMNGVSGEVSDMGNAYNSTFNQIDRGLSTLNMGMMNLSSMSGMVMRELGSYKSAMDWVYGTTSKEDTNKVLVGNMVQGAKNAEEAWDSLYTKIDQTTDASLTSMQDLIPAMNAFKSATQATPEQLENFVAEDMANFGAFVLAQTGSTQLSLTAMMDLSKGIRNQFNALDQYGVSKEALRATGKWQVDPDYSGKDWKGDPKDIEGYMEAVSEVIGSTDALMETNEGLNAQMGKMWSRAGKRIGHEMMPGLKSLKQMFIELDEETNGDLSTGVLRVALAIEEATNKAYQLNTLFDGMKNLGSVIKMIGGYFGIIDTGMQGSTLATQGNTQEVWANTEAVEANTLARMENAGIPVGGVPMGEGGVPTATTGTATETVEDVAMYTGADMATDALFTKRKNSGKKEAENVRKDINNLKTQRDNIQRAMDETEELVSSRDDLRNLIKRSTKGQLDDEFIDEFVDGVVVGGVDGIDDALNATYRYDKTAKNTSSPQLEASHQRLKKLLYDNKDKADEIADVVDETDTSGFFSKIESKLTAKRKRSPNFSKYLPSLRQDYDGWEEYLEQTPTQKIERGINNLKESYKKQNTAFSGLKDLAKSEDLSKGQKLDGLWGGLKSAFGGLKGGSKVAEEVVEGADAVDEVMDAGSKLATGSGKAGAIGAGMVEAEAGLSFMGLAEMGLSSAFTTLIVPTLAIAGVIAVLIPIIAGLAIEAMFFINIVAQFMEAMSFEEIDVDGAIEGLKSIAEAFAWLGVAMASMTFAGITTQLGMLVASLTTLVGGFEGAVTLLLTVAEEIRPLGEMEAIDDSVVKNLQNLGEALNNISLVMLSLVGLQLTKGLYTLLDGFSGFGLFGDAINKAKTEIQKAVDAINSFNFEGIDTSKVEKLKTVAEAIGSFSDAFSGLTKIRGDNAISDFISWLLDGGIFGQGGKSISEAFELAHQDIVDASNAIQKFTDVSDIDQTTVDRLSKVGEAIKGMGDAFEGLRKIRDDSNWDAMFDDGGVFQMFKGKHDIASALEQSKDSIVKISHSLKGLDGKLAKIPKNVGKRLQKVADTLTAMNNAMEQLKSLDEKGGKKQVKFQNYVSMIQTARKSLSDVSKQLSKFSDGKGRELVDMPEGLGGKFKQLAKTLENISTAIDSLSKIDTATEGGDKMKGYYKMIQSARKSLSDISKQLTLFSNGKGRELADIPEGLDTKIQAVATTLTGIATSIESLNKIKEVSGTDSANDFESYRTLIEGARVGLSEISNTLKSLGGTYEEGGLADVSTEVMTKTETIGKTLYNIALALENLKNIDNLFGTDSNNNFENYRTLIENAKGGLSEISNSLKLLNESYDNGGLADVSTELVGKLKNVTNTIKAVTTAMTEMQLLFDTLGGNGNNQNNGGGAKIQNPFINTEVQSGDGGATSNIENYKTTIQNSIASLQEVSGLLKDVNTEEFGQVGDVGSKINNVKSAISSLSNSATVMQSFPMVDGHVIGYKVGRAVTGLKRASTEMKNLNEGDRVEGISGIIENIKSSIDSLKSSLNGMSFGVEGTNIGTSLSKGVTSGLSGLSGRVTGAVGKASSAGASRGWTGGAYIAESMNRGFASAINLVDAVNTAMDEAIATIQSRAPELASASDSATVDFGDGGSGDSGSVGEGVSTDRDSGTGMAYIAQTTRGMLNSLNSSNLSQLNLNKFNQNRMNSVSNMNKNSTMGKGQQPVNIVVNEGAVQLDARNLTTKESRQVMINALEGLDMISGINLKGNPQK